MLIDIEEMAEQITDNITTNDCFTMAYNIFLEEEERANILGETRAQEIFAFVNSVMKKAHEKNITYLNEVYDNIRQN